MPASNTSEHEELVEKIAQRVHASRMEGAAILFLQMHLPLSFLASQLLLGAQPFLSPFLGDRRVRELASLCEDPANLERLIARLEQKAAETT